jgi:hypothetical protein
MEKLEAGNNVKKIAQISTMLVVAFLAQTREQVGTVTMAQKPKTSYNNGTQSNKHMVEQQKESPKPKELDVNSVKDREFVLDMAYGQLSFHGAEAVISSFKQKEWRQVVYEDWSKRLESLSAEDLSSAEPTGLEYVLNMIYVLREFNNDKAAQDKLEAHSQKVLSRALQPMSEKNKIFSPQEESYNELSEKRPHEAYRHRLNFLQKLAATQLSEEGRSKCAKSCHDYERNNPFSEEDFKKDMEHAERLWERHKQYVNQRGLEELPQLRKSYPKIFELAVVDGTQIVLELPTAENGVEEKWDISIIAGEAFFLRSRSDARRAFMFEPNVLNNDPSRLIALAKQAAKDTEQEKSEKQKEAMQNYELPEDRPIVVVRVIDVSSLDQDTAMKTALSTSSLKARALELRYPNNLHILAPIFVRNQDPSLAIESAIFQAQTELKREDIHVILDLYSHGQKDKIGFGDNKLTAGNIVSIAKNKPACTFTVDTIACYGGGLIEDVQSLQDFQEDEVLKKRIALFTHAKSNAPNVSESFSIDFYGAEVSPGIGFSDVYTREFIRSLLKGKTYGEAALQADERTKDIWYTDGEAIINGQKLSQATLFVDDEHIVAIIEKEIGNVS